MNIYLLSFLLLLQNPPDWQEILTYFRGSELQNYFTRILEDNLKVPSRTYLFSHELISDFNNREEFLYYVTY